MNPSDQIQRPKRKLVKMKVRIVSVLVFLSVLVLPSVAQDIQMNQPDHASATQGNYTVQSETNHVVTPYGIVGAWNDTSQMATFGTMYTSMLRWGYSADGRSFSGGGWLTMPPEYTCQSDPAVVADDAGFIYLAGLACHLGSCYSHFGIARSTGPTPPYTFGAATLLSPVEDVGDPFFPEGVDKELMAIDRTGGTFNNRIYLVGTETRTGSAYHIVEAHTTSLSPLTFTPLQFISPDAVASGAMPAVAPNGDVYVAWKRYSAIEFVKSVNGGDTFSTPVTVATFRPLPGLRSHGGGLIRTDTLPQIAIDSTPAGSPTRGYIYVVFHADPDGAAPDNADIFFTRSTDNGLNWSAPRSITSGLAATLNRDTTTNDSWSPSITVSPVNGHIYVTFYDRREDTSVADGDPPNTQTGIYRALSTDGGLTWSNARHGVSTFVPISGLPGLDPVYWGDYNWSTADSNGLHFTWGESHNLCSPPPGAAPCSPVRRPDPDVYYHTTANLSGADLFIQPSGAVTGIGPLWQTPDIYVVNTAGDRVNAFKGTVNQLRAHVRNLGSAPANGVTVRFRYAPWFAGLNDSMFREIGSVPVDFSSAAGSTDDQVVPIEWDLTDTADTNRGLWPEPISAFQHFCLTVTVEFSGDIHLSNNFAQNNFADVTTFHAPGGGGTGGAGTGGMGTEGSPFSFMVMGPDKGERASVAQLVVNNLPTGFRASATVKGVNDAMKGFPLKPNETRVAKVTFATPKNFKSERDIVADITLLLDGKPSGGIAALLYRSAEKQPDLSGIGPITKAYWEVKPQAPPARPMQKEIPPEPEQLPPVRTIPKPVRYRRTFKANYETVYEAIVKVLRERKLGPEMANFERGLINSKSVIVTRSEIAKLVDEKDRRNLRADGYYFCSLWLEPLDNGETEIGVDALIATSEIESPMGLRRRSNGTLERSLLDWIALLLNKP